jgi:hypothetical protein
LFIAKIAKIANSANIAKIRRLGIGLSGVVGLPTVAILVSLARNSALPRAFPMLAILAMLAMLAMS